MICHTDWMHTTGIFVCLVLQTSTYIERLPLHTEPYSPKSIRPVKILVDIRQRWMIDYKTYHRRWNKQMLILVCKYICVVDCESLRLKNIAFLYISLFVSHVSFIWYSGSRRTIGRCEGFFHSGREPTGLQRPKTSGLRKQKKIIETKS